MTPERWQKIDEIFQAVIEHAPDERSTFLTVVCEGDDELRREVESLLRHEEFATFIEAPIKGTVQMFAAESERELIDCVLGPYHVTSLIGAGGMGAVYAAVRADEQFNQQVAIKVVKRGMDTRFVLRRFRYERQILANLEHPNIARLLDGGTTADGLPYFVMEYIEGEPLTDYCAKHQLSILERVKLFRQVCSAVQYAHQKLIVHRDLKPSNILVNQDGIPKLLDFGIAKLLDSSFSGETITHTFTNLRLMTPDYASPEQVHCDAITTATDIYSLGAVLYELLTGQRPHRLENYTTEEIERIICGTEVERPSEAALRTKELSTKARKQLAGDLDNIMLMALRKEPERRYLSVGQFSEDLRRYLAGLPVIARGDTLGYRAGKFVRRHKVSVTAMSLVVISLLGGLLTANYQARRAERRFQQVRKLANTFLFDFHDKIEKLPGSTEAREMVIKTGLEYLDNLAQEAEGDTELQSELADAYLRMGELLGDHRSANLGRSEAAIESYRKGLALAQRIVARDPDYLAMLRTQSEIYIKIGDFQALHGEIAEGIENLRRGVHIAENVYARNPKELRFLRALIRGCEALGDAELRSRETVAALKSYQRTLELVERRNLDFPGDDARNGLALTLSRLGDALAERGDLTATMAHYRRALGIRTALIEKDPVNAIYLRELKVIYSWLGNFSGNPYFLNLGDEASALQYYQEGLLISEQLASDKKNKLAQYDLAIGYEKVGDIRAERTPLQGAEFYRKATATLEKLIVEAPENYPALRRYAVNLSRLGKALHKAGESKSGLAQLRGALAQQQKLTAGYPKSLEVKADLHATLLALGNVLLSTGRRDEALLHYRQALDIAGQAVNDRPEDLYWQWRLAEAFAGLGNFHVALAGNARASVTERVAHWEAARSWRRKALDVWDGWSKNAVSSVFNTTRREHAARALAQCDASLAQLQASARRR
jgi:tetratricopeptide (TPR) repeat protein